MTNAKKEQQIIQRDGYERLWKWFGFSYASWLTMPRVMMHQMPDEWQNKMAELLEQWDDTWDSSHMQSPSVTAKGDDNKYTRWPEWLLNYTRPDIDQIEKLRRSSSND